MAAATANPGVRFSAGQSLGDLGALNRDLRTMRDLLRGIRDEAKTTASAFGGLKGGPGGLVNEHGQPFRQPETQTTAPRAPRQAKAPAADAERNIFAGMQGRVGMSDAEWKELGKKQAERREQALKAGMDLNPTERKEFARTRAVTAAMRSRTGEDVQGMLGRAVNAVGWSPFMPQSMYLAQMALGEMGLGLGLPFVAAGMGALGLGAGGLALNAFAVDQARTGNQLAAQTGAPPFTPNTYVTGAAEANLLAQRTGSRGLNLPDKEGAQAVSALAAGGLSSSDAFGRSLDETAALINAFGMSVQDAAGMVTTWRTDLHMSDDQVTAALASLAKVADATGQPLAALGQIVQSTPNMLADLAGDPSQYGPAASLLRTLGGTTQGAQQLGSVAYASGSQALRLAGLMGISDQQLNALQGTTTGQAQLDNFVIGLVKRQMAQAGGAADIALLTVNGMLGTNFDKATLARLNALPANATAAAYQQATQPPSAAGRGSVDAFITALEQGNPAKAAALANPANVKDVTLNAAQVFLNGALSQTGEALGVTLNAGAYQTAALQQIARQGGIAGIAAGWALFTRGYPDHPVPAAPPPPSGPVPLGGTAEQIGAGWRQAAPGGGGGGGQTITINLRTDGRQVASLPVQIGPNQQYEQYVPNWHAPGRGPQ